MDPHDIESLCPKLQKFVIEVARSNIGISTEAVRIRNLKSGRNSAALCGGASRNDRFSLVIPYCDHNLVWDVIFLCNRPEMPPDFFFQGSDFLEDVDCDFLEQKIPSLANWDHNDAKALLKVILELLFEFKFHQLKSIPENHRAFMEIGMLLETDMKDQFEVMKHGEGVRAMINVLPDCLENADDNFKIVLTLNYTRFDNARSSFSSCGEHQYWDPSNTSDLPTFHSDKHLILDYLPEIKKKIETIVNTKLRTIAKRKQLILQFYVTFKSSIVEFDAVNFSFVVFSLCRDEFEFFVRIDLPRHFPYDAPSYKLISNYCLKDGYDRVEYQINNVRYAADMPVVEVVQHFYAKFYDTFNNFKRSSVHQLERNLSALKM